MNLVLSSSPVITPKKGLIQFILLIVKFSSNAEDEFLRYPKSLQEWMGSHVGVSYQRTILVPICSMFPFQTLYFQEVRGSKLVFNKHLTLSV